MKRKIFLINLLVMLIISLLSTTQVNAQSYRFEVTRYDVQAVIEADGTLTLFYEMDFQNDQNGHIIDFVDLGLPNRTYAIDQISATINDKPIPKISHSSYVLGAELDLGEYFIPAGGFGTVKAKVTGITQILFPYDHGDRDNYINFQFTPNYFDPEYDKSKNTDYTFSIVLPPAVGANEGVYYKPTKWSGNDDPSAELTLDDKRVIYTWKANNANTHTVYTFGAAFPATAVPESAISLSQEVETIPTDGKGFGGFLDNFDVLICLLPVIAFITLFIYVFYSASKSFSKRKFAYMPPTLSVEGHGIKRGLTAVEAGILLEKPLDKILTMILFGLLKKEAITVTMQDPLLISPSDPFPKDLYEYELDFIQAFKTNDKSKQRTSLKLMMIELVKSVENKMKGFNSKDTKAYYKSIVERAWQAVEQADTPEIKSAQLDHTLEWTMLDEEFSDRTTRTFTDIPVFLPRWWGRFDPMYTPGNSPNTGGWSGTVPSTNTHMPSTPQVSGPSPRPSFSLPNLPGAAFASTVINRGADMAKSVIGNTGVFTSEVTTRTNPIPISVSSSHHSGGGGSSCACACACAGCACACAGGGR